jgi:hypothetical protein
VFLLVTKQNKTVPPCLSQIVFLCFQILLPPWGFALALARSDQIIDCKIVSRGWVLWVLWLIDLITGAGQDVGKSCVIVTVGGKNVMFDCGMHMGFQDERRYPDFSFISKTGNYTQAIDCVIVTHL